MFDLEDMETFIAVADTGGITAAAHRLGISKSIVSRRLFRLEAEFGVQLLARTTRGAALTEAGATFREHAVRIRAEMDAARESIQPGDLRGRLRIAAPMSLGPTHFAPIIADLACNHPLLHVQTSYSDHFVDIVGGGFDCAVRIGHLRDSNLVVRRIGKLVGMLVASPGYIEAYGVPESPEELSAHQALMQGTETWQFVNGKTTISAHPQGRFKADHGIALVAAAVAGLGIARIPECLISNQLDSGELVPVMTRYPLTSTGIYVVRPPGQHPARKVSVFTELMIAHFG